MSVLTGALTKKIDTVPPHALFGVSAIFHYLGPSFAVLLFPVVGVLGIAWMRVASAALIFAPWAKPWQTFGKADNRTRTLLLGFGFCIAVMNMSFYLALERLPMSLVAAIEFVGAIGIALYGLRSFRNLIALLLAITGIFTLISIQWSVNPMGLFWALLNGLFFIGYIILGHKAAEKGTRNGMQYLGTAMFIAFIILIPIGLFQAMKSFSSVELIMAGIGVGLCSSVIPYCCDQITMSKLSRASFALLLTMLPAIATLIAAVVLAQTPTSTDIIGIVLVMAGIAVHRPQKIIH